MPNITTTAGTSLSVTSHHRSILGKLPPTHRQQFVRAAASLWGSPQADDDMNSGLTCCLPDHAARCAREIEHLLDIMSIDERRACEDCGAPIAEARLQAVPFTTRCVACESRAEKLRPRPVQFRVPLSVEMG